MSIRLEIDGQAVIEFEEENIVLGSDPGCTVPFAPTDGLAPKHAVIRKIAGRWIVEVRGGDSIQVGDAEPARMHWLNPGDVIRLTASGPTVQFEPALRVTKSARRSSGEIPVQPKPPTRPKSETIDSFQLSKPKSVSISSFEVAGEKEAEPPKSRPKSTPSVKQVEFEEATAPEMRPLPALAKSSPWLGNTEAANSKARGNTGQQRLYLIGGGAAALVIVGLVIYLSTGSPRKTIPISTPGTETTASTQAPKISSEQQAPRITPEKTPETTDKPEAKPDPVVAKPVDPSTQSLIATPSKPASKTPSATLVAVRDGVFAVFAKPADRDVYYRLGTAWAASKRHLVTSGAVALAVENLKKEGASILVSQPFQDTPIAIKGSQVHAAYASAVERAAAAKARIDDEASTPAKGGEDQDDAPAAELAKALSNQARFDLGVLEIDAGQRLPTFLKMQTADMGDVSKADFLLVGFPFAADEYQTGGVHNTGDVKERVATKNSAVKNESDLSLNMRFPADVVDEVWSGSPVFDRSQRVIGVYSRPALPAQEKETPQKRRHAIIWLGRLREFAPDLE